MVEKSHLPVRIVGWQSIPGPLDKPEILIGQQLYARTSGELSEKLVKEWRFSKGLPKFVKDDLDILRREFE
jgi:hypothetical protein